MAGEWRPCALVPVYNHEAGVAAVVNSLLANGLPVILVNDGSGEACSQVLRELATDHGDVRLVDLPDNRGKGAAVKAGLRAALALSYSHALQIDADGQHAAEDAHAFLETGRRKPAAFISGLPLYDEDIPSSRYYGRYLTHFWVAVNTMSGDIQDSMCGFRLYPLAEIVDLVDREFTGNRMDFDTEVMVRWSWRGGEIIHIPTRVRYPSDGVSHFNLWRDNLLITKMHTRLFFGMLWRFPRLLKHRLSAR